MDPSNDSESASAGSIPRVKACTNCRRRKIKCDGVRPKCDQCRLRPPRLWAPCHYPALDTPHSQETPAQMLETIRQLKDRIEDLELLADMDPSRVYLNHPYLTPHASGSGGTTWGNFDYSENPGGSTMPCIDMVEPPLELIVTLVDTFLGSFLSSGTFFLDPVRFRQSALLPLPFGDQHRPSPALLSAVYLWGSILTGPSQSPYTPDAFLLLLLETVQAEVLLSLFYLYAAHPVQGRYHCAAATSLALGAHLHLVRSPQQHNEQYPPFPMGTSLMPGTVDSAEETEGINAFWGVVILNNYWVATDGSPSFIPYDANIHTPWPFHSEGGATITKFLNGNDAVGSSLVALLAKASILLERIIAFCNRTVEPADKVVFSSLETRLLNFQASLPLVGGAHTLMLTHAFTDLAIIRLHAPYVRISETSRYMALTAAARIAKNREGLNLTPGTSAVEPIFGAIYATIGKFYMSEMIFSQPDSVGGRGQDEYLQLEMRFNDLMTTMASLAPYSPIFDVCVGQLRQAHADIPRQR
ncbi:hypothetical protein DFH09DRAFT_1357420 [Mycena vulgaris]|nr:hypothetical protein DFH09DRAFT_1357420 [Mycena vulgaris]